MRGRPLSCSGPGRARVPACLVLSLLLLASPATAASLGKKPDPLSYLIFGLTLEDTPRTFRDTLKKGGYLHTKTEQRHGMDVMSFTAVNQSRLFTNAFVASCPATARTVGVYVYGEDGDAILAIAGERFGIEGNDRQGLSAGNRLGGPMHRDKTYRKSYPNVTVSFYRNRGYESYTLALESPEALEQCRRQTNSDAELTLQLRRQIVEEAARARPVD